MVCGACTCCGHGMVTELIFYHFFIKMNSFLKHVLLLCNTGTTLSHFTWGSIYAPLVKFGMVELQNYTCLHTVKAVFWVDGMCGVVELQALHFQQRAWNYTSVRYQMESNYSPVNWSFVLKLCLFEMKESKVYKLLWWRMIRCTSSRKELS